MRIVVKVNSISAPRDAEGFRASLKGKLHKSLLVSCQAREDDPFRSPECMARFALAAVAGGATGVRVNGPEDVRAVRRAVNVPIIGIDKTWRTDGTVRITGSFESARRLVEAGADMIAIGCCRADIREGAPQLIARVRAELAVPVLADIAALDEAKIAAGAGADFVLTTLRGYTPETAGVRAFDPGFISELSGLISVPVIAEGRIDTPALAAEAIRRGAYAVIVGTAVTRPADIARRFAAAVKAERAWDERTCVAAIDLGSTNTKFGVVSGQGRVIAVSHTRTSSQAGQSELLKHLQVVAGECIHLAQREGMCASAIGVATGGWVDASTGSVTYATGNLSGWTGAPIGERLAAATGVPVAVENDANAAAIAEKRYGAARDALDFISITLGTGLGGGCYVGGQLARGRNCFASAIGHIKVESDGLACTCGQCGCLEAYANAAALVRYAGAGFSDAEQVIAAAATGSAQARQAIALLARYLARGCTTLVQVLDPELIVLSGGLTQRNPFLIPELEAALCGMITASSLRKLHVIASPLEYHAGLLGAAAIAQDKLQADIRDTAWSASL